MDLLKQLQELKERRAALLFKHDTLIEGYGFTPEWEAFLKRRYLLNPYSFYEGRFNYATREQEYTLQATPTGSTSHSPKTRLNDHFKNAAIKASNFYVKLIPELSQIADEIIRLKTEIAGHPFVFNELFESGTVIDQYAQRQCIEGLLHFANVMRDYESTEHEGVTYHAMAYDRQVKHQVYDYSKEAEQKLIENGEYPCAEYPFISIENGTIRAETTDAGYSMPIEMLIKWADARAKEYGLEVARSDKTELLDTLRKMGEKMWKCIPGRLRTLEIGRDSGGTIFTRGGFAYVATQFALMRVCTTDLPDTNFNNPESVFHRKASVYADFVNKMIKHANDCTEYAECFDPFTFKKGERAASDIVNVFTQKDKRAVYPLPDMSSENLAFYAVAQGEIRLIVMLQKTTENN